MFVNDLNTSRKISIVAKYRCDGCICTTITVAVINKMIDRTCQTGIIKRTNQCYTYSMSTIQAKRVFKMERERENMASNIVIRIPEINIF